MLEAVEGVGLHKLGLEIMDLMAEMLGMVVKVIRLQSQEQTKSSVQEAVVVQEMVLMELVDPAQEMVVDLQAQVKRTAEVAVVAAEQMGVIAWFNKVETVVVELSLLDMIPQILCL